MQQLPLGISLKPGISFDSFILGGNAQAVSSLQDCIRGDGESFIFLWGGSGIGKTHLLQSACRQAGDLGQAAAYIPLRQAADLAPAIFEDLDRLGLLCLDDVEQIAGNPAWEQALFNLFNRLMARKARLLVTADRSPAGLGLALPDLASRLSWGLNYRLQPLSEEDRFEGLLKKAAERGLKMPEETARYLLRRCPRDTGTLLDILDRLDRASLAAQHRLTIPFVRTHLGPDFKS
ncbi:MAG TPA: DnaA regulatory inactivator Hda [Sedimenticola sp.]|nr:DnaA regulatory inactivator Hda [Sedimenticola sp.]